MTTGSRAGLMVIAAGAVVAGLVWAGSLVLPHESGRLRVRVEPQQILADGADYTLLTIETSSRRTPRVAMTGAAQTATLAGLERGENGWSARIRAGIVPGRVRVRVTVDGAGSAAAEFNALADWSDRDEDGTPDVLRLSDEHDRQAFRRWFTYLAEAQYFQPAAARPAEIVDCAALVRYAYREALRRHDKSWADESRLQVVPAYESVEKYRYPFTPLGPALFRVKPGPLREADAADGAFLQFADAQTMRRFNTHHVGRQLDRAQPGDLLFFRQSGGSNFHSMVYVGESPIQPDGRRWIVYHTGPEGADPGEIRRLTVEELNAFPRAEWRPLASNANFLGVARWNILRRGGTHENE